MRMRPLVQPWRQRRRTQRKGRARRRLQQSRSRRRRTHRRGRRRSDGQPRRLRASSEEAAANSDARARARSESAEAKSEARAWARRRPRSWATGEELEGEGRDVCRVRRRQASSGAARTRRGPLGSGRWRDGFRGIVEWWTVVVRAIEEERVRGWSRTLDRVGVGGAVSVFFSGLDLASLCDEVLISGQSCAVGS